MVQQLAERTSEGIRLRRLVLGAGGSGSLVGGARGGETSLEVLRGGRSGWIGLQLAGESLLRECGGGGGRRETVGRAEGGGVGAVLGGEEEGVWALRGGEEVAGDVVWVGGTRRAGEGWVVEKTVGAEWRWRDGWRAARALGSCDEGVGAGHRLLAEERSDAWWMGLGLLLA